MLIKNYKILFTKNLEILYDAQEIESFFYLVLENVHQMKRIDLALHPMMEIDATQLLLWEDVVSDLKRQKPIQYILGETEFFGLRFLVNKNTLIPRPETEELVQVIISNNQIIESFNPLKILDIGTGSGCIAISLAKNLSNAVIYAIDVSKEALDIAKRNAEINNVAVTFLLKNIFDVVSLNDTEVSAEGLTQQFDVIVSNPPYVRNLEKAEIKSNVLKYEPHIALFVDDADALLFYRKIAKLAIENLTENGKLYFEINQYLGRETVELVTRFGFKNVKLLKDIYGNDRIISCEKNGGL